MDMNGNRVCAALQEETDTHVLKGALENHCPPDAHECYQLMDSIMKRFLTAESVLEFG